MEIKQVKEVEGVKGGKRQNWEEVFTKLKKSKSGVLELKFKSKADAKRTYNSLTNPYYKKEKGVKAYLRETKVFLECIK